MKDSHCKECNEIDNLNDEGLCIVCWTMENHPEQLTLTEEDAKEMERSAAYLAKHKIEPNLDSIY